MTLILSILGAFIFYQYVIISPKAEADWAAEYKLLPSLEITDNYVSVKNLRDFRYSKDKIESENYLSKTYDLNKLQTIKLGFEPSSIKPLASTFLVFNFEGGESVVISAQPRREVNESSSSSDIFWSNVNKYELIYVWGTEKDFIQKRTLFEQNSLSVYPLSITKEDAKAVFLELAKISRDLEQTPVFYNNFAKTENELTYAISKIKPELIPQHYSLYLLGYLPKYLYKLELISNDLPFEEVTQKSSITSSVN